MDISKLKIGRTPLWGYNKVFITKPARTGEFTMIIAPITHKERLIDPILEDPLANTLSEMSILRRLKEPQEEHYGVKIPWREPNREAERMASLIGQQEVGQMIDTTTDHVWLVVLGHFAQALGLVAELAQVPVKQKQGPKCTPQEKLIEFLVGILGGIEQLQELNTAGQPIATDATVIEAWAQEAFVHYSQVSRTLQASDEETLAAVVAVLREVSQPYLQQAVVETLKKEGRLTVDLDLSGREVSPTSSDYAEATFGWMDDDLAKGYQAAITALVCQRWGRLMLTLQRYTGRTLSAACVREAIKEVEELLGLRPRRRVALVKARRQELMSQIEQLQQQVDRNQDRQNGLWQKLGQAKAQAKDCQPVLARLEADYQARGWQERPHSRLAKLRRRLVAAQKRQTRTWRDLKKRQTQAARMHHKLAQLQADLLALEEWWAYLDADNQANPNPVTIVLRIDAGFSSGPNLAWLVEMGYTILTKACHSSITQALRRQLPAHLAWTKVGRNAEATAGGDYYQNDCPYPLQAMLVRYHLPDQLKHTTLLYYGDAPPPPLPAWFARYNARQTIEAGIKEAKAVFTLKRHLVRSPIGMQLQEQFALFGANFVRWAAAWVKSLPSQANHRFLTALDQVKTLVRTVAHARARWVRNQLGNTLIFDQTGPFAGTVIRLSGHAAVQLALPLFNFVPS
jgi:hypothetical protein